MKKKLLIFSIIMLLSFAFVIPKTNAFEALNTASVKYYYKHNPSYRVSTNNNVSAYVSNIMVTDTYRNYIDTDGNYVYIGINPSSGSLNSQSSSPSTISGLGLRFEKDPTYSDMYRLNIPYGTNYGQGTTMSFVYTELSAESPCYIYNASTNPISIAYRYQISGGDLIDFITYQLPTGYTNLVDLIGANTYDSIELTYTTNLGKNLYYVDYLTENYIISNVIINQEVVTITPDFGTFIIESVNGFLDAQVWGGVSIGTIFGFIIMIPILIWLLKMFFGG